MIDIEMATRTRSDEKVRNTTFYDLTLRHLNSRYVYLNHFLPSGNVVGLLLISLYYGIGYCRRSTEMKQRRFSSGSNKGNTSEVVPFPQAIHKRLVNMTSIIILCFFLLLQQPSSGMCKGSVDQGKRTTLLVPTFLSTYLLRQQAIWPSLPIHSLLLCRRKKT